MADAYCRDGTLPPARNGRLCVFWSSLAALLLIFMGVTVQTPSAARPEVEYSAPRQVAVRLRQASADPGHGDINSAPATVALLSEDRSAIIPASTPMYRVAALSHPYHVVRHAYEATGPPLPALYSVRLTL